MVRVRSKDTKPEVRARSAAHALGHRFRIHVADLPGKPDLANKARRWAIFVHGCFWHSPEKCRLASKPRSNTGYWSDQLARNPERDPIHAQALRALGYPVLVFWRCATRVEAPLRGVLNTTFVGLSKRQ